MKTMAVVLAMLTLVPPGRSYAQNDLSIEPVKDGLYTILRPGGNAGVLLGPEGVILVDDRYPEDFTEIQKLVSQVSDLPVMNVLSAQTIVAPERVREYGSRQPEFQTAVHIGGLDVRAVYVGPGHTNADAVIYFPDLKTVLGGDLLRGTAPFIDYAHGGSIEDWLDGIDNLLALDFDTAIPKHGAVTDRTDAVRFRNQMEAVRVHMAELAQSVISQSEIADAIKTPQLR